MKLVKDGGTPASPTNALAEVDGTNLPGWYQVLLTTAECTADVVVLGGKSSTSGVVISGTQATFEQAATAIADAVLARDVSNVESTAPEHSLATIVLATTEWAISGTTWTIYRTDGTTTHFAKTLAATAGAAPVTSVS